MKIRKTLWISLFVLSFASFSCTQSRPEPMDEEKAVMAAVDQFYAALNAMFVGELEPMVEVWSHADDVTYMGPMGGFQVGWPAVLEQWKGTAEMKLGGSVLPADLRVTMSGDLALTHNYEVGENTNAKGAVEKVSIRVTNVFRKEGGSWKMIGHHTDLLPYLVQ